MLIEADSKWHEVIREALKEYLELLNNNQDRDDLSLLELHRNLKKKQKVTEILHRMQVGDNVILEIRSK
ncbi:hypothetical protein [Salibacter halophilus]|uniref:Uncharacterized protein n=1 Tax=Salibacter halophilus TaxID=1803916 RepID=A0A6N6M1A5_9FLAO|nr:hypothetical protein [Salibacter halophilus]KAB1061976.1 hypothetical protein F3059_12925 [Salibacter halophilus]